MTKLLTLSLIAVLAGSNTQSALAKGLCEFDCHVDADCMEGLLCADAHKSELKAAGYDERKANCGQVGPWDDEVCFDPVLLRMSGGGFGDPHFKTYDGTMYSYHGQCDLVLARSADFGAGLGMDVHARTSIVDSWSLISDAAIRIGEDVFEVANDDTHFLNGKEGVEFPFTMAGQYTVTKMIETFSNTNENDETTTSTQTKYVIDLGNNENISIGNHRSMLSVQVNALLGGTEGMLGIHGKDGLIGRDRETTVEANEMGAQWQVNDSESMLFTSARSPQFPEACVLPQVESRRLRQTSENVRRAEAACAGADQSMIDFCIEDVLLTGDAMVANTYGFAF